MEIKRLAPGDEVLALELGRRFKDAQTSTEAAARFVANDHNCLLAAYVDGDLAGFVLGYELQRIDWRGMMCLYEIDLREQYRRRGIGKALVGALTGTCRKRRLLKMWVGTGESNTAAKALYASTGGVRDEGDTPVGFTWLFE